MAEITCFNDKNLRSEDVPIIRYTWIPLFTMIDWRYRFSDEPLESFYLKPGLFQLNPTEIVKTPDGNADCRANEKLY